jgi:hypothetical protein
MNRQFIQVTHGLLPVAVLVLLVVALVAGQSRVDSPGLSSHAVEHASADYSTEMLQNADSLPAAVERLMTLPAEIDMAIKLLGDSAKSDVIADRPSFAQ